MKRINFVLAVLFLLLMNSTSIAGVVGDADGDGKVGVADAINALQVAAGLRTSASASIDAWKIIKIIEVENDAGVETDEVTCFVYSNGRLSKKVQYSKNRTSGNLYGEELYDFITDINGRIRYQRGYSDWKLNIETYEYDADGRLIGLYDDRDDDGIVDEYKLLTYGSEGRITRIDYYEGAGDHDGFLLLLYNEDGQINRWEYYAADEEFLEYGIFYYETDGRLTHETVYDVSDNLVQTNYFTCKKISSPANDLNDYIYQFLFW